MLKSYKCCECSTSVVVPKIVSTVSCPRCGDVSFVTDGNVRRMYPALHMRPVTHPLPDANYPLSIWMPTRTRPIEAGLYHVRFRHTEPHAIPLHWNGYAFVAPDDYSKRIDTREFLTWRGVLA
jgi:hypothetical protein